MLLPPEDAVARALQRATAGFGADEAAVARSLAGVLPREQMPAVAARFDAVYGQTLAYKLEKELGGDFERACLRWIAPVEPAVLPRIEAICAAHPDLDPYPPPPPLDSDDDDDDDELGGGGRSRGGKPVVDKQKLADMRKLEEHAAEVLAFKQSLLEGLAWHKSRPILHLHDPRERG